MVVVQACRHVATSPQLLRQRVVCRQVKCWRISASRISVIRFAVCFNGQRANYLCVCVRNPTISLVSRNKQQKQCDTPESIVASGGNKQLNGRRSKELDQIDWVGGMPILIPFTFFFAKSPTNQTNAWVKRARSH